MTNPMRKDPYRLGLAIRSKVERLIKNGQKCRNLQAEIMESLDNDTPFEFLASCKDQIESILEIAWSTDANTGEISDQIEELYQNYIDKVKGRI
jgi:hypothetical protein